MRILVTGAGGYIGRHVVSALLEAGAEVIAADIRIAEPNPGAQNLEKDIFSLGKKTYKELGEPDACVHLAWKDGFQHNSDAHMAYLSNHYIFLRDMLNGGLKHLAVMGTMHEVGYWEGAIDENTPCNPQSLYGIAKDALRRTAFQMTRGRNITLQWLRAFYIYGDDERSPSIFGKIAAAEKEGKEFFPFTTGKNKYDFISVDELSRQIAACVMQTEVKGIINCCTGKPVSLAEQVQSFIDSHGYRIQLQYGAYPDRPYDSPAVWGSSERIERIMKARG